ncbi:MAG: ferredoxin [Myxococcaceae bacterium]
MARFADRLPENAAGDFFVDSSCIDCDLCRQLAPSVFDRAEGRDQSYVRRSVERLLDFSFEWVLPGHGRRFHAPSPVVMKRELAALVRRMGGGR